MFTCESNIWESKAARSGGWYAAGRALPLFPISKRYFTILHFPITENSAAFPWKVLISPRNCKYGHRNRKSRQYIQPIDGMLPRRMLPPTLTSSPLYQNRQLRWFLNTSRPCPRSPHPAGVPQRDGRTRIPPAPSACRCRARTKAFPTPPRGSHQM